MCVCYLFGGASSGDDPVFFITCTVVSVCVCVSVVCAVRVAYLNNGNDSKNKYGMRQGLAFSTISSNNNSNDTNQRQHEKEKKNENYLFPSLLFVTLCFPTAAHSPAILNFSLTTRPVIHPCFSAFLYIFIFTAPFALQRYPLSAMKYSRIYDFGCERCFATNIAAIMSHLMALFTLQRKRRHRRRPLTGSVNVFHSASESVKVFGARIPIYTIPFRIIRDYIWREAFALTHNHSRSRSVRSIPEIWRKHNGIKL